MKKVIKKVAFAAAAVVVAANIYLIQKTDASLNTLDLDNVETLADGEPLAFRNIELYDMVVGKQWQGCATGDDGYLHSATFTQWDCIKGSTLFSCRPYVEVIIYED
jgi:hypothetical protein